MTFLCYVFLAGHSVLQQCRMQSWSTEELPRPYGAGAVLVILQLGGQGGSIILLALIVAAVGGGCLILVLQLLSLCLELTALLMPWQCLQYADEARDCQWPDAAISRASLSLFLGQSIPVSGASLSPITTPGSSTAPAEEVERLEPAILTSPVLAPLPTVPKAAPSSTCCRTPLLWVNCADAAVVVAQPPVNHVHDDHEDQVGQALADLLNRPTTWPCCQFNVPPRWIWCTSKKVGQALAGQYDPAVYLMYLQGEFNVPPRRWSIQQTIA